MRRSDGLDIGVELLPRHIVRVLVVIMIIAMWAFNWWEPVYWYISDKAAGITESVQQPLLDIITRMGD